jgi:hypothetical protein
VTDKQNDVDAIKQLKARYFRFLDTKQWDQWRTVFSDDFTGKFDGEEGQSFEFGSADEIVAVNREILATVPTVHQGHTPEIAIKSPDTASGIWAMYDRVELPGAEFEGWGHYHEDYVKVDGEWKISRIHLKRLRIAPLS